jgi:hypothetical protein
VKAYGKELEEYSKEELIKLMEKMFDYYEGRIKDNRKHVAFLNTLRK